MFSQPSRKTKAPKQIALRLFRIYLCAVAVAIGVCVASLSLQQNSAKTLETRNYLVGISDQQPTLSQRILSLAYQHIHLSSDGVATASEQATVVRNLERALSTFTANHAALTNDGATSAPVRALFLEEDAEASLDQRVSTFVTVIQNVLTAPTARLHLTQLRDQDDTGLTAALAQITTQIEAPLLAQINANQWRERAVIATVIAAMLVQIAFTFAPGFRLLKRIIAAGDGRERQLHVAQNELDLTNHTLRRKNAEIEKEKTLLRKALDNAALLCGEQAAFTYSVSHDLKSPANTLQLLLDELFHEHASTMTDDGRELLQHAQESISLMSVLIEDVLQYSWATDPNEQPKMVDLHAAANAACEKLHQQITNTGALISLGTLHQIKAAPHQIDILLHHLLSNALTFQPDDHIPNVHLSTSVGVKPDTTILRVEDNGIGIASEDHGRVFGLFQRLHLRDTYPGSGLGLATCQRIAANHSGSIKVQSALGQGCIFEVTLGPLLTPNVQIEETRSVA